MRDGNRFTTQLRAWSLALCLGLSNAAGAAAPWVRWEPPAWGPLSGQLGLGFQGKPISDAQRVVVNNGHFYTPGPDGAIGTADDVRMRWFGVNLAGVAAFPPESQAKALVATLASWGFNAVRLHYIDAPPSTDPTVVNTVLGHGAYPSLNPVALGRLRRLLAELRDHGMYVQLNPIAAYTASPEQDGVPPLGDGQARLPTNNPLAAIEPALLQRQQRYLSLLASALDLAHQPALAQVDVVNESSLLAAWTHWDPDHWQRTVQGPYARTLNQAWESWVTRTHGSPAAAWLAWGLPPADRLPVPTPRQPTAEAAPATDALGKSWAAARTRLVQWAHLLPAAWQQVVVAWLAPGHGRANALTHDHMRFLATMDQRHVEALRTTLHQAIRPDLPVAGTQASYGNGWNAVAHAGMDFVDEHFYVDHYQFPGPPWDMANWYQTQESLSGTAWGRLASTATLRDSNRPYVISEFGQPYPNPLGQELVLAMATLARLQDWDGLFLFDHDAFDPQRRSPAMFDLQGDWPRSVVSALASQLYRNGRVAALPAPASAATLAPDTDALTASWLRQRRPDHWTHEARQTNPALTPQTLTRWSTAVGAPTAAATASPPKADTGAQPVPVLTGNGLNRLSAQWPGGAWVSGRLTGGSSGHLDRLKWHMPLGEDEQWATVVLTQSSTHDSRWLLAVITPTVGSNPSQPPTPHTWVQHPSGHDRWTLQPAGESNAPSAHPISHTPLWTEPARLRIELPAAAHRAQVWRLNAVGERTAAVALQPAESGRWLLPVNPPEGAGQAPALWFEINWPRDAQ